MIFSEDEVADAKWLTWNEIDDLVKDDNFIQNRWDFVKDYLKEEIFKEINIEKLIFIPMFMSYTTYGFNQNYFT